MRLEAPRVIPGGVRAPRGGVPRPDRPEARSDPRGSKARVRGPTEGYQIRNGYSGFWIRPKGRSTGPGHESGGGGRGPPPWVRTPPLRGHISPGIPSSLGPGGHKSWAWTLTGWGLMAPSGTGVRPPPPSFEGIRVIGPCGHMDGPSGGVTVPSGVGHRMGWGTIFPPSIAPSGWGPPRVLHERGHMGPSEGLLGPGRTGDSRGVRLPLESLGVSSGDPDPRPTGPWTFMGGGVVHHTDGGSFGRGSVRSSRDRIQGAFTSPHTGHMDRVIRGIRVIIWGPGLISMDGDSPTGRAPFIDRVPHGSFR